MKKLEILGKKLKKEDQRKVLGGKNKLCGVLGEPCFTGSYGLCCNSFVCGNDNICYHLVP